MVAAASAAPAPGREAQPGGSEGLVSVRRNSHKTPLLGMKFDRDPQQLEFFLAQVGIYMQDYGPEIVTEGSKLRCVTIALEGTKAMVNGHPP